jgi:cytochrome c peroxidase
MLFWDKQVGGDGIQACGTCHYHAGADHRKKAQASPGLKANLDTVFDFLSLGGTLSIGSFSDDGSLPADEAALAAIGANLPDDIDGGFTVPTKVSPSSTDTNDVVSSQGIHNGTFTALSGSREDTHVRVPNMFQQFRNVEPRNAPTIINAVFNFRNFWDGRADAFFNGVTPLGFRDTDAKVRVNNSGTLGFETLRIPLSALASQAVGPIESSFEMAHAGRSHRDLGKKLQGATPLLGQEIMCDDHNIGSIFVGCVGSVRGVTHTDYATLIKDNFANRFWDSSQCFDSAGNTSACGGANQYSLLEYNFALFFGLAVQAYEATLVSDNTMIDLLGGGIATEELTVDWLQGRRARTATIDVTGIPLDDCAAAVAAEAGTNNNALLVAAEEQCLTFYAGFIPDDAWSGSETDNATADVVDPFQRLNNTVRKVAVLTAVDRGLGRFEAGATGCAICHFNPEFTGQTVAVITGSGALPPVPLERMIKFSGAPTVYDAGFYNIGVRPTGEDISLGDAIGGVPLAFSKLAEAIAGGNRAGLNSAAIDLVEDDIADGNLKIPTAPDNLAPRAFTLEVACGNGLVGIQNGQGEPQNTVVNCDPIIPGENLLRNGAFHTPGLRNVNFTGPYMHNGSKMDIRAVVEFYKTAGHFPNQNFHNLDAGMRIFDLGVADEAALVEMLETGLTDWDVAYERGKFGHPEICIPHGNLDSPETLVGIPVVGTNGNVIRLQTFAAQLLGDNTLHHHLNDVCTVPGVSNNPI